MSKNSKPLRPCNKPGCSSLTRDGYCDIHKTAKADNNRYYDKYQRNKKHDRFYHSITWIRCRDYIKIRDNGLCQQCLREKRITIGKIVDHIIPLTVDWNKRLDEDNLQLICQSCHNKKTAEDKNNIFKKDHIIPGWLKPSAIPLTIVCGPSGGGKTTYVNQHASIGDIIIDLDDIKSRLSGKPWYEADTYWTKPALVERNKMLERLATTTTGKAWFIVSSPKASERSMWRELLRPDRVVVLETPLNMCTDRLSNDNRRSSQSHKFIRLAEKWWDEYTRNIEDDIIK